MNPLTLDELTNWEEHGATWRLLEDEGSRVLVEMCTCYGEPVDVREAVDPVLVSVLRGEGPSGTGGGAPAQEEEARGGSGAE